MLQLIFSFIIYLVNILPINILHLEIIEFRRAFVVMRLNEEIVTKDKAMQ